MHDLHLHMNSLIVVSINLGFDNLNNDIEFKLMACNDIQTLHKNLLIYQLRPEQQAIKQQYLKRNCSCKS